MIPCCGTVWICTGVTLPPILPSVNIVSENIMLYWICNNLLIQQLVTIKMFFFIYIQIFQAFILYNFLFFKIFICIVSSIVLSKLTIWPAKLNFLVSKNVHTYLGLQVSDDLHMLLIGVNRLPWSPIQFLILKVKQVNVFSFRRQICAICWIMDQNVLYFTN